MFQKVVNRNYTGAFPGQITFDGPKRAKPGRITSATGTPSSACFSTATICSTEKRFFFTQNLPSDFAED